MSDSYLSQLDKDGIHVTTRPYLNKVLQHTKPYEVDVFDRSITVLPGVMSPAYDWAGHFLIECLPTDLSGKTVLELGSGTGLVSVFAGLRGAKSVTAVDINPAAVKNTHLNLEKLQIHSRTLESDVFSALPNEQYDLILFNLPYHNSRPQNDLEKGVMDDDYQTMERFFREARTHLTSSGELFVGFSQSGNIERFHQVLKQNGFQIDRFWERNDWHQDERFLAPEHSYNCQVYRLTPRSQQSHFPSLPLLDWVTEQTKTGPLDDCLILAHMHLLPNNVPLFQHLANLVSAEKMLVLDKPYSTVPAVFCELTFAGFRIIPVRVTPHLPYEFSIEAGLQILWMEVEKAIRRHRIKKILVVDDGGEIWRSIPKQISADVRIVAVEQTQRGITRLRDLPVNLPVMSVATSGVKKLVEPSFIATSIISKLKALDRLKNKRIGIIGMGSIGQALYKQLKQQGFRISMYDISSSNIQGSETSRSLEDLINKSDLLIGTTGSDALHDLPLDQLRDGKKVFVSASSADVEFATLLRLSEPHSDPFGTIHLSLRNDLSITILNGGYPINFDRQKDTTPDQDIVLTRCLMYMGAIQGLHLLNAKEAPLNGIYRLDTIAQEQLLTRWIEIKEILGEHSEVQKESIPTIAQFEAYPNAKHMKSIWS